MKGDILVVIFTIFTFLSEFSFSTFLGGTINWRESRRKVDYQNPKISLYCMRYTNLRFTWRMTFEKGTGPCSSGCSAADIGRQTNLGLPFNDTRWTCAVGCSNPMIGSDMNYVITAIGKNPNWEQGENTFEQRMTATIFTISMHIPSALTSGHTVILSTTVDTRVRNDTRSINASPVAALPPYIGVPFGCISNISLPVIDPDADIIKCRWATPAECGQSCTDLPQAYLDENSCTIHMNATNQTGFTAGNRYRVAVTVEDFPRFPIKLASKVLLPNQPINSIPLQFFVDVVSSSSGCKSTMTFAAKNFPDSMFSSYSFLDFSRHIDFVFPVYLLSKKYNTTFVQSFTQYINTTTKRSHSGSLHLTELYSKWRPVHQQFGENLLCVWGKSAEGITTRKQCIVGLIADSNECLSNPCHGSATCVNLYMKYTCSCPSGFRGSHCQEKITCGENPCLNNGTCSYNATIRCQCRIGFTGDLCQFEDQPCVSFPCKNGGKCITSAGRYRCQCPGNFTGDDCGFLFTVNGEKQKTSSLSLSPFILAGSLCGAFLLGVVLIISATRVRSRILQKVKDAHSAKREEIDDKNPKSNKTEKNIPRVKTRQKFKSSAVRKSLDF